MSVEWVLGVIAALFGGLNVFQVIFWRSEKQKMKAEADEASAKSDLKWKELVNELKNEVRTSYQESIEAQNLRNEENEKHLNEISCLRREIINLKDEITSLKKEIENLKPEPKAKKKPTKKEA